MIVTKILVTLEHDGECTAEDLAAEVEAACDAMYAVDCVKVEVIKET